MRKKKRRVYIKQIVIAQWTGDGQKLNYSTLGVDVNGDVYRFDVACQGWYPLPMTAVECEHRR